MKLGGHNFRSLKISRSKKVKFTKFIIKHRKISRHERNGKTGTRMRIIFHQEWTKVDRTDRNVSMCRNGH
jgi:hypothetical protein